MQTNLCTQVTNVNDTSVHSALSLCGINSAVATTPALDGFLAGLGLRRLGSTIGLDHAKVLADNRARFSKDVLVLQVVLSSVCGYCIALLPQFYGFFLAGP